MAAFFIIQYSQAQIVILGISAVQGREWDSKVLMSPFQLRILCDC